MQSNFCGVGFGSVSYGSCASGVVGGDLVWVLCGVTFDFCVIWSVGVIRLDVAWWWWWVLSSVVMSYFWCLLVIVLSFNFTFKSMKYILLCLLIYREA